MEAIWKAWNPVMQKRGTPWFTYGIAILPFPAYWTVDVGSACVTAEEWASGLRPAAWSKDWQKASSSYGGPTVEEVGKAIENGEITPEKVDEWAGIQMPTVAIWIPPNEGGGGGAVPPVPASSQPWVAPWSWSEETTDEGAGGGAGAGAGAGGGGGGGASKPKTKAEKTAAWVAPIAVGVGGAILSGLIGWAIKKALG
jgi:hypothetical protein